MKNWKTTVAGIALAILLVSVELGYITSEVATSSTNVIAVSKFENTSNTDSLLENIATSIEIRVYN